MSISLPKKARLVSDGSCQSGDAGQAVRERWQSQALLRPNNKRKTYTGIEDTGVSRAQPGDSNQSNILPCLVVREILQYVAASKSAIWTGEDKFSIESQENQISLLSYRLVCRQWNEVIENTGELMRSAMFLVHDIAQFLKLMIVKKGKVRSVRFENSLNLGLRNMSKFIDAVVNVQTVILFGNMAQHEQLLRIILETCTNLQVFKIEIEDLTSDDVNVLKNLPNYRLAATKHISHLSFNFKSCSVLIYEDMNIGIAKFFLRLPYLQGIYLYGGWCNGPNSTIVDGLSSYMEKYGESLQLKKLALGNLLTAWTADYLEVVTKFLVLCGDRKMFILQPPVINLNHLTAISKTPSCQQINKCPLFTIKINGAMKFEGLRLYQLENLYALKMGTLQLSFSRDIFENELSWISDLDLVEYLNLRNLKPRGRLLDANTIAAINQVLSTGFHLLKEFEIYLIYDSALITGLPRYFPYLQTLCIQQTGKSPNTMIQQLTELESLSTLSLRNLKNLKDAAFTRECRNKYETNSTRNVTWQPAIACFKSLRKLRIDGCSSLTNAAVIHGISKCKMLTKLTIWNCRINEYCRDFVQCKVNFVKNSNSQCIYYTRSSL